MFSNPQKDYNVRQGSFISDLEMLGFDNNNNQMASGNSNN
jgi:hypothetical protein